MHAQSRAKQPSLEALVTLHTTGAADGPDLSPLQVLQYCPAATARTFSAIGNV